MSRPGPVNSARPCSRTVESTVLAGMVSMLPAPSVTSIHGNSSRAVASAAVRKVSPVRSASPAARRRHALFFGSSARSMSRSVHPSSPIAMPAPGGRGSGAGACATAAKRTPARAGANAIAQALPAGGGPLGPSARPSLCG